MSGQRRSGEQRSGEQRRTAENSGEQRSGEQRRTAERSREQRRTAESSERFPRGVKVSGCDAETLPETPIQVRWTEGRIVLSQRVSATQGFHCMQHSQLMVRGKVGVHVRQSLMPGAPSMSSSHLPGQVLNRVILKRCHSQSQLLPLSFSPMSITPCRVGVAG